MMCSPLKLFCATGMLRRLSAVQHLCVYVQPGVQSVVDARLSDALNRDQPFLVDRILCIAHGMLIDHGDCSKRANEAVERHNDNSCPTARMGIARFRIQLFWCQAMRATGGATGIR